VPTPFDNPPDRSRSDSSKWRRYRDRDVIPMWVADMDFPAADPILEAVRRRVEHGVFGYTDCDEEIDEVVLGYFERTSGWKIEPEWIVYSPGLGVAIHAVCRLTDGPGDEIITPAPIYHVFRAAPALAKRARTDIQFSLADGEWSLDPSLIAGAAGPKSKVFQLCNPHNPNGKVFGRKELEEIAGQCLSAGLIICSDEVHSDLILDDGPEHVPIASLSPEVARRTITLASPSKAYNVAGLNFGVAVIPDPDLRERYRAAARGLVISHLNPLGIAAAKVAWGGECDGWLEEAKAYLRSNRDYLRGQIESMPGLGMERLPATYLAWIDVSGLGLEDPPAHFERFGVGMSPGEQFGDKGRMRLNFGCSRATLEKAAGRLRKACEAA